MMIDSARITDAQEILDLQRLAYQSEAALYNDQRLPPLLQTLQEMEADIAGQVVLKLTIDGRIVGSVRAHQEHETCTIGRLIVHPRHQNRGLGRRLLHEIELRFPGATRFELFTGHRSDRALHLYHELGYREYKSVRVHERLTLVHLEKVRQEG